MRGGTGWRRAPLLALILLVYRSAAEESTPRDYCIVGAGPAGLQLGYFLQKAARDYVIFERSNVSGSFFLRFPVHGKLISINKRHTGKVNREFNLRHDWNSLLTDDEDMQYRHYSREYFPPKDTLLRYLNDFEKKYKLNVQHNTLIGNITRHSVVGGNSWFSMSDQHGRNYACNTVIVATGIDKPNKPVFEGHEYTIGYESVPTDREFFEGKSVLILGRGNAAMEVAQSIYGATNLVHVLGRSRVRLSWETHYVGDVRGVNNELLDAYMLKSLDGILESPVNRLRIVKQGDRFIVNNTMDPLTDGVNNALREPYDVIVRCLGFKFDFGIFDNSSTSMPRATYHPPGKYPLVDAGYESLDVPGLYFAGTVSHSVDFRKSSGGFIHGFRYTARTLLRLLEFKKHGVPWPAVHLSLEHLLNFVVKRLNEASGTYQMFQTLCDVIILEREQRKFKVLEEFPLHLIHQLPQRTGHEADAIIVMVFEYGKTFSGPGNDNFRLNRATAEPIEGHLSNFLHPVFYYYKTLPTEAHMNSREKKDTLPRPHRIHHMVEDFLTMWDCQLSHVLPLRRYLETCLEEDLRNYFAQNCFLEAMTSLTVPLTCEKLYLQGRGVYS